MKLAFSTLCCLDDSAEKVISYALNGKIDGVELRVNDKGETLNKCTAADAESIRGLFSSAGVTVTDLALSCTLKEYDKKQLETGKNGIDFACALGVKGVRVFAGEHQTRFGDSVRVDFGGMVKALRELSEYGESRGVDVLVETHSCYSSGRAMRQLIDAAECDNIKVIWDVLHSLEYREPPEETVSFLGKSIAHVHLKDGRPGADEQLTQFIHTDLGAGVLSVPEVVKALDAINYNGFYSLEWESPWREEIRELYPDVNDLISAYRAFTGEI